MHRCLHWTFRAIMISQGEERGQEVKPRVMTEFPLGAGRKSLLVSLYSKQVHETRPPTLHADSRRLTRYSKPNSIVEHAGSISLSTSTGYSAACWPSSLMPEAIVRLDTRQAPVSEHGAESRLQVIRILDGMANDGMHGGQ